MGMDCLEAQDQKSFVVFACNPLPGPRQWRICATVRKRDAQERTHRQADYRAYQAGRSRHERGRPVMPREVQFSHVLQMARQVADMEVSDAKLI